MSQALNAVVVVVTWGDAHALSDSWGKFESKDHKPRQVVSVGFVLREDKVGISICQSCDTEKHDDHGTVRPRRDDPESRRHK